MSFHNKTFDPSTVINHAANMLCVIRTSIGTNESSCPFYLVGLETDDGSDRNHKHVINKLALFGLFLLENMYNLNKTRGFPGISFLNTAEGGMALLNIGISGLSLKSNVQVGNKFLMDEVIGKALLMKSMREAMQEYDAELPLDIAVLEHHLGPNVYVSTSTSMYEPAVITEDGYDDY